MPNNNSTNIPPPQHRPHPQILTSHDNIGFCFPLSDYNDKRWPQVCRHSLHTTLRITYEKAEKRFVQIYMFYCYTIVTFILLKYKMNTCHCENILQFSLHLSFHFIWICLYTTQRITYETWRRYLCKYIFISF